VVGVRVGVGFLVCGCEDTAISVAYKLQWVAVSCSRLQ